ncbi:MAG: SPFH domain-containing protein [Capsulimonadales bacterium]|nr:SPFH domain-containing protein [Capsulimonadales bacterium]
MKENGGLALSLTGGLFLGIALMIVPFFVPGMDGISRVLLLGFGGVVTFFSAVLAIITNLFVRTRPDEAFVRTGIGGAKVIIDGGTLVIPVVHQVKKVPLRTLKLEVERRGTEALITSDFLRVDVKAAFFVRVAKEIEAIQTAASTLPDVTNSTTAIQDLVQEKLVSALRTVAAQQTLNELNTRRNEFAARVQEMVTSDLSANGLTLESVTISNLDQAPLDSLRPDQNVFDAQGARTIAQMVAEENVKRNEIERNAQRQKKEQDVAAAKYIAQRDVEEANARAEAEKNKQVVEATARREAAEAIANAESERKIVEAKARQMAETTEAEERRKAEIARAQSQQAIQVAEVERQKAVELANQEREKQSQVAGVERQKEVSVREQERAAAIARSEQQRALAEAEKLAAENARETALQEVETTRIVAEAERRKKQEIIQKETEAERLKLEQRARADADAYGREKAADADKQAASKMAEAQLLRARADREAKELEALGEKAVLMVPVAVEAEKVTIERQRIEVLQAELEAKAQFSSVSVQLEIAKAMIEADKEAKIASAQAMGQAFARANLTIWGDPDAVKRMNDAFLMGQQTGALLEGLNVAMPEPVKQLLNGALGKLSSAMDTAPPTVTLSAGEPKLGKAEPEPVGTKDGTEVR